MSDDWRAVYWRNYVQQSVLCESLQDARDFLEAGSQENTLAAEHIVGPDGTIHPPFGDARPAD